MEKLTTEISITWSDADVLGVAQGMDVELSAFEVSEVLKLMKSEHDANSGINWAVIEYHIAQVVEERE